ncbi:hypothetical protein LOC71_05245 [Rhodopirellula sp. JC740]|uniref:Uncharacterized protein n=1 Tax=Rhodopirellula halodulae TaxID=2894198 RepID=A0ABS8NDN9_9BACT|nr:hypothetical protein [Rhodopirellula sp. JC740]MCC9641671.1 hypothetical protein [Rhodopirellula sp. JC740]
MKLKTVVDVSTVAVLLAAAVYAYTALAPENAVSPAIDMVRKTTTGKDYSWQKECDATCAKFLGTTAMQEIDGAGCNDLLLGFMFGLGNDYEKALRDKIVSIPGCSLSGMR